MSDPEKSTSAPLPWIVLSGLLGVFAVGVPAVQNSAKKDTDKKDAIVADTSANLPVSGRDPYKPIYDFHATHDGRWTPEDDLRKFPHGYEAEFLIATVPDPIDSPLGHAFDEVVDAIQRAVEKKNGYVLDRCWLPWELDRRIRQKSDKITDLETLRQANPGVLLFRHGKDKARHIDHPGLCVVFLVGETPIGGLHKRAFTKALNMMTAAGHPIEKPVRVLGPYFSGSQNSLQFAISDWLDGSASWFRHRPRYRFDIITGSAGVLRPADFFDIHTYGVESSEPNARRAEQISVHSTMIPTPTVLNATLRYLARRDACSADEWIGAKISNRVNEKVAILTESSTSFGQQFAALAKDEQLVYLRFPLHISCVKTEFTQALHKKEEQLGIKHDEGLLRSTFDDSVNTSEGIPAQGGQATTAANGQVLSNILATIARENCRYVGILATDARDKLFLIRLIREYCPDVHVFITETDQLLLHPDSRYHMRGVIIGSTYPLVGANQRWVRPNVPERVLFPSSAAQGCYNAALIHMGLQSRLLEYRAPTFVTSDDPQTEDLASRRPPIWISVVAPDGSFVPLQVFTNYEDPAGYIYQNPDPPAPSASSSMLRYPGAMLPVGIGLFAFWVVIIYQAWFNPCSRMFWQPASIGGQFSLPQLCYRNLLLGSQVLLAAPILALVSAHAHHHTYESIWMPILGAGMLGIVIFLLLGMIKPLCWPPSRLKQIARWLSPGELQHGRSELWIWTLLNLLIVGLFVSFTVLFLMRFWIYGDQVRRNLFFVRAVDLGSGLSPLTPLLFMSMGFFAWAFFQLKRNHLADRYRVPPPYPATPTDHEAFQRVDALDCRTQEEVRYELMMLRHPRTVAMLFAALIGLGFGVWEHSLPSMEGWSWDGIFFVGFWLLFGMTASLLIRLVYLWSSTKKLLRGIALIPMMRIFVRLPIKITDLFGKYLVTQKPQLAHLEVQAHQLRLLVQAVEGDLAAPKELTKLGQTSETIDRLLCDHLKPGVSRIEMVAAERKIGALLSGASAACLRVLAPSWQGLSVEVAFGEGGAQSTTNDPSWVALAENLAAAQSIIHVSQYFVQLRNLVWSGMICSSLLLLAATCYPFHPEHVLLMCLMCLTGGSIVAVIYLLIEMNRDELVSRISKTTQGRFLDSGFISSFLTYIVPIVGLLAAQLSGSFRWLLEPLLRVMK